MIFSINFMTSLDILYTFRQSIIQLCRIISYVFLLQIYTRATFFVLFCSLCESIDQCRVAFLFLWSSCGILSIHQGTVHKSPHLFVPLVSITSSVGTLWVCSFLGGSFSWGDQGCLSFFNPLGYICFF